MLSEPWATRIRKVAESGHFGETQLRLGIEKLVADALGEDPPETLEQVARLQEEIARLKAASEDLYQTNADLRRQLEFGQAVEDRLRKAP